MRQVADEALARADIIASLPPARQAVSAKDREKLLTEYAEMFAVQRDRRGGPKAAYGLEFSVFIEEKPLRQFALNYVALGTSLMVNVLLFRFNVVGRYVQEQLYYFLIWAIPLLMLTMATSILLVAMA